MSLTIGEAHNINVLLAWIGEQPTGAPTPSDEPAYQAARQLADRAYRALGAGLEGDDIARLWPRREVKA